MDKTKQGELLSAMADGEVQGEALALALQAIEADPQLRSTWDSYHLVGDVLRSSDLASHASSAVFLARLRPALAREDAPAATPLPADRPLPVEVGGRAAANDGRWKIFAGLASVAAVLAVGWNLRADFAAQQPQLAAAPAQPTAVLAAGERNVMLRDARLDELLAAHRQFGSPSAIQMPTGALRNAAFETPAR